jgi:surface carbohydrate biosynthesis protein
MKPDVVIHPFPGGQYKIDFLKKCKEWGCKVIIRRGEAGASRTVFDSLTYSEQTIMLGNWDYDPYIDLELVWGKEFGEIVAEKGHVTADKIVACGAFAFDIYFQPDMKRSRNRKKMVLFATGFSAADSLVDYCECGLPKDAEFHKKQAEKHTKARAVWIEKIREWHETFKDSWDFSLKVRPGERVTEYVEKLGDILKVYPQTYSAHEALKDTDMLIHCGSTMAMEAHCLKIPAFNFRNINPDKILANLSPQSSDGKLIEDAFRTIDVESTNVNWSIFYELKNHLYGSIDGTACQRAAHVIHQNIDQQDIQTNIPDTWPIEALYLTDDVMIAEPKKRKNKLPKWLCPACKNRWWTEHKVTIADCPFCGMAVERTGSGIAKNQIRKPDKSVLA